jgi:hypothetical protein
LLLSTLLISSSIRPSSSSSHSSFYISRKETANGKSALNRLRFLPWKNLWIFNSGYSPESCIAKMHMIFLTGDQHLSERLFSISQNGRSKNILRAIH